MKLKQILVAIMLLTGVVSYAHDFDCTVPGGKLYFNTLDKSKKTVEITYPGKVSDSLIYSFEKGYRLDIPETINRNDGEYKVVKIGAKAFESAEGITDIVLPATLKEIGNYAFKDCKELNTIYFNSNVELGIGVFYDCTGIENIRFGGDWKKIDFEPYRWSTKLSKVVIPPSTMVIDGLKYLKNLTDIEVDELNKTYASENGILYDKEKQILIYCPRNYGNSINIYDGCVIVKEDAFSACVNTEKIIIPASVKQMSFRETRRMKKLEEIVLGASMPFATGYDENGTPYFFFQLVERNNVKIYIPKKVNPEVFYSQMPSEGGNFSVKKEKEGPFYPVFLPQMPLDDKKHLLNVK